MFTVYKNTGAGLVISGLSYACGFLLFWPFMFKMSVISQNWTCHLAQLVCMNFKPDSALEPPSPGWLGLDVGGTVWADGAF